MQSRFRLLFTIFYSTSYTILYIILLAFLLATPVDLLRHALADHQIYNIIIIAGAYLATLVLAVLNYAARLWTNRTALSAIPKTWIPIEKSDVGKRIRKMIVDDLRRSAMIAWDARPRTELGMPAAEGEQAEDSNIVADAKMASQASQLAHLPAGEEAFSMPSHAPVWGNIEHPGWSSPFSPDLANLQYSTVIAEIPNLIEAKAVSLAPATSSDPQHIALFDVQAVELLQRPETMGVRDYVMHLVNIRALPPDESIASFLEVYEFARFSSQPLSEAEFRALMKSFSAVLRSITALDINILGDAVSSVYETDIDDDASSKSTSMSPRSRSSASDSASTRSRSSSTGTVRTAPSRRAGTIGGTPRPSFHGLEMTVAPVTPSPTRRRDSISRNLSSGSSVHPRASRAQSLSNSPSGTSIRSVSSKSVLRLNMNRNPRDLPYNLTIPNN